MVWSWRVYVWQSAGTEYSVLRPDRRWQSRSYNRTGLLAFVIGTLRSQGHVWSARCLHSTSAILLFPWALVDLPGHLSDTWGFCLIFGCPDAVITPNNNKSHCWQPELSVKHSELGRCMCRLAPEFPVLESGLFPRRNRLRRAEYINESGVSPCQP
jgi:hypothetical protein